MKKKVLIVTLLCLLLTMVFPSHVIAAPQDATLYLYEMGVEDLVQVWFQDMATYQIRFVAPVAFKAIDLEILSDDNEAVVKVAFYNWDKNLERTLTGTPVSTFDIKCDFYSGSKKVFPLESPLPAGEYVMTWEVEKSSEADVVGMYGKTSLFEYCETYQDGELMVELVDHFLIGLVSSVEEGTELTWQALSPTITEEPPTPSPTPEATPTPEPTEAPAGTTPTKAPGASAPSADADAEDEGSFPIVPVILAAAAVVVIAVVVIVIVRKKKAA